MNQHIAKGTHVFAIKQYRRSVSNKATLRLKIQINKDTQAAALTQRD